MNWRAFLGTLSVTALAAGSAVFAFIVLADPWDTVWFSPPLDRPPVTTNQRFSFPSLARQARFDSAIIGTSTTRLLRPADLDPLFDASFVNLSLNSGTAYEQARILEVFARHHANAKSVIFGIDTIWCQPGPEQPRFTFRPFPAEFYDDNRWNDLRQHFNLFAAEQAGRQFLTLLGWRPEKYGRDGYTNFLPPAEDYDLERARVNIYGSSRPSRRPPADPGAAQAPAERATWNYPSHRLMAEMLARLAPQATKILVFAPYHVFRQPVPGSREAAQWDECRKRLVAIAADAPNAHVLDFMIPSEITRDDRNYWDPLHYSVDVAGRLARLLAEGVDTRRSHPDLYRYLGPAPAP